MFVQGSCTFRAERVVRINFAKQVGRSFFKAIVISGSMPWGCVLGDSMGLLLPSPFQPIIFCSFLCQPWKCKSLEKASHYSFCKNDAHSSFSTESAQALHKSQNRGFTFHQSLYCNTGSGQPECIAHQANWCAPADHPGVGIYTWANQSWGF